MNVLLMGMGLQGKAVAHYLETQSQIAHVQVLDNDPAAAQRHIQQMGFQKISVAALDAGRAADLQQAVADSDAALVINMLPVDFGPAVARAALDAGIHYVSSSYTGALAELDATAKRRGVIILPEMGMDPGIDLILGRLAVDDLDRVYGLYSYGAGLPDPDCRDDNVLHYKISWTFEGVLKAYMRDAVMLKNGRQIDIAGNAIFQAEHAHAVDIPGLGALEAYPNGDAVKFIDTFGLKRHIRHMGRFALRWPGHCRFWSALAALGLLDGRVDAGLPTSPRDFLVNALTPQLQYQDHEKDVVILRIEAWGIKDGAGLRVIREITDHRDLTTGLFAMNRTVGYSAAIGAMMILTHQITTPGVLSPVRDVAPQPFLHALAQMGIEAVCRRQEVDADRFMPDDRPIE